MTPRYFECLVCGYLTEDEIGWRNSRIDKGAGGDKWCKKCGENVREIKKPVDKGDDK